MTQVTLPSLELYTRWLYRLITLLNATFSICLLCSAGVRLWWRPKNVWLYVTWLLHSCRWQFVWRHCHSWSAHPGVRFWFPILCIFVVLSNENAWAVLSCDFLGNHCKHRSSHESLHSLNTKVLSCVNVHPVHKQYLLVAESRYVRYFCNTCTEANEPFCLPSGERFNFPCRTVKIYDNRSLKSKSHSVSELQGHSLRVASAYFSPSTGNRVLTSCADDCLRWPRLKRRPCFNLWYFSVGAQCVFFSSERIFDTSEIASKAPLLTSIG